MDAEHHVGHQSEDDNAYHEEGVEAEHREEATFAAETVRLNEDDCDKEADDDEEGGDGAGLLLDVVWREAGDGDVVKGVFLEGADPEPT